MGKPEKNFLSKSEIETNDPLSKKIFELKTSLEHLNDLFAQAKSLKDKREQKKAALLATDFSLSELRNLEKLIELAASQVTVLREKTIKTQEELMELLSTQEKQEKN